MKKVLAGLGLASLLAGVALSGCASSQKSSETGGTSGAGGSGNQQQTPASSSCHGSKSGSGCAGGSCAGMKK